MTTSKLIVTFLSTMPGFGRITRSELPPRCGQWVVQRCTTVPVVGVKNQIGYEYGPVLFNSEFSGACFDWIGQWSAAAKCSLPALACMVKGG